MKRSEALALFAQRRRDEIVVTTMSAYLEWPRYSEHPWDLVDGDTMGQATPVGLGLALAQPDRQVWVFNGDGSQLMTLGSLVTAGSCAPRNLVIFIFRNDSYEITGGQPIPGKQTLSFPAIAAGCGFVRTYQFEDCATFAAQFDEVVGGDGPVLVDLKIDAP
ncbi:MAG: thiamine pyrophosphate-dependent enzyme [Ardenticatenaceae bacterium]|nr:thiamine pyrophosphate-dependent enzyme [Ardenticatenaceae bacterium]